MVDVSQYTGLITSEHADKPKFTAMVSAVAQCFVDQQNALGNFIPSFDLDEAMGAQLDTLGAWVGIGRRVRTPLTGVYFSFDIAGVGFDQGVWQGPFDPSTGITVLDDDTYRLLIRAKIGANHWDGTLASSAAILNLIFQGGTTPRHLTATNELFATADGVKGAFQLTVGGVPVYSNINVASIYRNDWQGNQLLYATARTNNLRWSQDITNAVWNKNASGVGSAPIATGSYAAAPDGSMTATRLQFALNGGTTSTDQSTLEQGQSTVAGVTYAQGLWLRSTDGSSTYVVQISYSGANVLNVLVNGTWQFVANPPAVAQDTIRGFRIALRGSAGTSQTADILAWGAQRVSGSVIGSYIPTTTAAVTVTDYTVGTTGIVSMGQKPVSGAQLTWNGTGDAYPGGTQVFIEDHQDMSISFGVAGKLPSALFLALLSGGYIPIKPEGVHVRDYVTTSVDGAPIFGFDMMGPYVAGFDVGTWGTPLH